MVVVVGGDGGDFFFRRVFKGFVKLNGFFKGDFGGWGNFLVFGCLVGV